MATILVVDDELGIRALLTEILSDEGHSVEAAEDAAQARALREAHKPDLVLLDIWMPDVDGITLLKEWASTGQLTMPVIMMSGHGTIDTAVEAMKFGAAAFLEKPITLQKLLRAVEEGLTRPAVEPRAGGPGLGSMGRPGAITAGAGSPGPAAPGMMPGLGGAALSHSAVGAGGPVAAGLGGLPAGSGVGGVHALAHGAGFAPGGSSGSGAMDPYGMEGGRGLLASQQVFELDRPLREARDAFEKAYFEYHLARENGSMTRVAEKTGLERTHLYRKLKHLGVDLSRTKRHQGG